MLLAMIYGSLGSTNTPVPTFDESTKTISDLYELARKNIDTRQKVAATYYGKQVLDDVIQVGTSVYVYFPRNQRVKLALSGCGSPRFAKLEIPIKSGNVTKWTVSNKLKRASPM